MLQTLLTSFTLRGEKAGRFCEVAGESIVDAGGLCFAVDTLTVDSRVTYIKMFRLREMLFSGGGLMRGIKIPQ